MLTADIPLPNRSATVVTRALLEHVIQHYSSPILIISDNAREFTGTEMKDFCRIFDIKRHNNTDYSPELSCYIERYHAWQGACLTIVTSRFKTDWDLYLPLVSLAYRTTIHASTGFTPFEVLRGYEPRMPYDSWCTWGDNKERNTNVSELQRRMREIYEAVKKAHDKAVSRNLNAREKKFRDVDFEPGDLVLKYAPKSAEVLPKDIPLKKKMMDRWSLPQVIVAKGDNGLFVVRDINGKLSNVRADAMRKYRFFRDGLPSLPPRRKFTAEERKERNKAAKKKKVPDAKIDDMICFPMEMSKGKGPGFGIGRVIEIASDGSYNAQFYSNDTESLYGTFRPCWLDSTKKWYCGEKRSNKDNPLTTAEYYPSRLRQRLFAAVGFQLMEDDKLPQSVMNAMSEHPDYQWSLRNYDDDEHSDVESL